MLWDDLRYFLAVARSHSLTDAGRHLRVSASTVCRRIGALERALDQQLFRRHSGGYTLTPAGERLVSDAEEAEARILCFQRNAGAAPDDVAGIVRVASPELLAHELIIPRLGEFCEAYPALTLELLSDVRPVSLTRDEADVVLRVVRPTHGDYTLRRFGQVAVGLFASESYLVRHGTPDSCAGLSRHRLIAWDHDLAFLHMARWLAATACDARVVLRTTTFTAQLGACRAGCGIAALPVMIGERYGLRQVLVGVPPLRVDLWLIIRSDLRATRRVRVVCDFLADVLSGFTEGSLHES